MRFAILRLEFLLVVVANDRSLTCLQHHRAQFFAVAQNLESLMIHIVYRLRCGVLCPCLFSRAVQRHRPRHLEPKQEKGSRVGAQADLITLKPKRCRLRNGQMLHMASFIARTKFQRVARFGTKQAASSIITMLVGTYVL